jgi:hypothetical protein
MIPRADNRRHYNSRLDNLISWLAASVIVTAGVIYGLKLQEDRGKPKPKRALARATPAQEPLTWQERRRAADLPWLNLLLPLDYLSNLFSGTGRRGSGRWFCSSASRCQTCAIWSRVVVPRLEGCARSPDTLAQGADTLPSYSPRPSPRLHAT